MMSPSSDPKIAAPVMIPAIAPDGTLYPVEKLAAHRERRLHLAVSVFVFRGGRLLVQRRASGKYHCAGLWANTCCSHPHWGEDVAVAARRRLEEEMGLAGLALRPTAQLVYAADVTDGLHEHEHVHVFQAHLPPGAPDPRPDPSEVSDWRWATPDALLAEARDHPESLAPWFRIYLARWPELHLDHGALAVEAV